jgi:glycosyltransferase involved in cell wall biosynthesis
MAPFEVVVVDDGSTDDSVPRLQSLAAGMPWLRVHCRLENRGVNAACNTGLDLPRTTQSRRRRWRRNNG